MDYDRRPYGWSSGNQSSDWGSHGSKTDSSDSSPNFNFNNKTIRGKFIQKVLSIVTVQLVVTLAFVALFTLNQGAVLYAYKNTWLINVAMVSTMGLVLVMSFSVAARRTVPLNMVLLAAYTVCQGFLVGIISSFYQVDEVLYAVALTAAIVFGLAMYAQQTKEDFTLKGGMMFSMIMALSVGGLVSIFYRGEFFNFILACAGAAVFSMYIIYDLQMIMGDKKLKISEEEFIFAALNLYVDIMRIFMELLKILRYMNDNSQNQQKKNKRN